MMDEIGRLHPNNVKGILRFANERNILLIMAHQQAKMQLITNTLISSLKSNQKQKRRNILQELNVW
jgi:hypothetical protein